MEQTPKYYLFSRQAVGNMTAAKMVMDKWTGYTIAGSGLSALGTVLGGGKIDLLLPIIAGLIGLVTLSIRELLSFLVGASVITNPINTNTTQVISQPDPVEPQPQTPS